MLSLTTLTLWTYTLYSVPLKILCNETNTTEGTTVFGLTKWNIHLLAATHMVGAERGLRICLHCFSHRVGFNLLFGEHLLAVELIDQHAIKRWQWERKDE